MNKIPAILIAGITSVVKSNGMNRALSVTPASQCPGIDLWMLGRRYPPSYELQIPLLRKRGVSDC